MRTELASGAWIEHVPIQDLKGKHKRDLERAGRPPVNSDAIGDDGNVDVRALLSGIDMMSWSAIKQDALWALLIDGWSYELPVPQIDRAAGLVSGADSFDELPIDDYEEIEKLFAPYAAKLNRKPNPKAPEAATTTSSNGSSRASGAHGSRRD